MVEKNLNNGINETTLILGNVKVQADKKTDEQSVVSPFCQSNCKICNSGYMEIVHEKIRCAEKYRDITAFLLKEYNFSVSASSITRHWKNYKRNLTEASSQRAVLKKFAEESDDLLRHQKQVTVIADGMFELIAEKIRLGVLDVSVTDYANLLKIRHGVLNGDNGAMDDLVGIFQQATDKYGVNLSQGVLFKKNTNND